MRKHISVPGRLAVAVAVILVGCRIVGPESDAVVVMRGTVTASGAPLSGARVWARSSPATDCSQSNPYLNASSETLTDANGTYLLVVPSTAPGSRCLRGVAFRNATTDADSVVRAGFFGTFKENEAPDTLNINFSFP